MKIAEHKEKVLVEGEGRDFAFEIEASGKAFQILVSGIYSDPIKAIIRELSTNAWDSHIQAGNTTQKFDVKLPNWTNPVFSIRDYGTGLSPYEMEEIFTVIFRSNKTDSNELTGCFGLGSKSPFSYTKNFTIESWKDGKYYTYMAYMDQTGRPRLKIMDDYGTDTDEPNGTRITIAVKQDDCSSFKKKAEEVYEYFDVLPNVSGETITVKQPNYIMDGNGWKLRKSEGYYGNNYAKAVMGNVAYNMSKVPQDSFTHEQQTLLRSTIDIFFDIGDLDIEAGREGLHYDDRTIRKIKERLEDVLEDIKEKAKTLFVNCKSLWEARCNFSSISTQIPSQLLQVIDIKQYATWNNQLLYPKNSNSLKVDIDGCTVSNFEKLYNGRVKKTITKSIAPSTDIQFFENDLNTGANTRIKAHIEDGLNNGKYIILVKFDTSKSKDDFIEEVGCLTTDFTPVSTLPKPTQLANSTNSGVKKKVSKPARICKFDGTKSMVSSMWPNATKDLTDGGYYVNLNSYKVEVNGNYIQPEILVRINNFLSKINKGVDDIWGIKTAVLERAKKVGQWESFIEYAKKELEDYLKTFDAAQHVANIEELKIIKAYNSGINLGIESILEVGQHTLPKTMFYKLYDGIKKLEESSQHNDEARNCLQIYNTLFGKEIASKKPVIEYSDFADKINKKYRLLSKFDRWASFSDEEYKQIASYINAIEGV